VPGSLVYVGLERDWEPSLSITSYNAETCTEKTLPKIAGLKQSLDPEQVHWINVYGIHQTTLISTFGREFELHPLVLEDIVNTLQRPKIEEFKRYLFFSLQMLSLAESGQIVKEQVSFILGSNFVLSFQEEPGDIFDPIRNRIRNSIGRIRTSGSDYLVYVLLDAVVDHYYLITERLSEQIDKMESDILDNTSTIDVIREVLAIKSEVVLLRRSLIPLRDAVSELKKGSSDLITPAIATFLNDLSDHINHHADSIESLRDGLGNLIELNQAFQGNRMNQVMKTLTIISTIFIPLSFLAGLYGMNFTYIPELGLENGYFYLLGLMGIATLLMIIYFKRKGWF